MLTTSIQDRDTEGCPRNFRSCGSPPTTSSCVPPCSGGVKFEVPKSRSRSCADQKGRDTIEEDLAKRNVIVLFTLRVFKSQSLCFQVDGPGKVK